MEKLTHYKQIIKAVVQEYERLYNLQPQADVEEMLVADDERGQYLLLAVGWQGRERVSRIILGVRLRNGKIWIEEDWTERGLATDLLAAGVPRDDIVLAFHPPHLRDLTEFAVA